MARNVVFASRLNQSSYGSTRGYVACVLGAMLALHCGGSGTEKPLEPDHGDHGDHADHAGHADHAMGSAAAQAGARGAHLAISCGAEAQAKFDQAFVLLHNMDYVAARRTFEETIASHPQCAMLHWGVAMTYFQPLWAGQPTADALHSGAAAVAQARAATESSDIEREYVTAVAAFYDGDKTDYAARLKAWAGGQRQLAEHHPDDVEAQAFFALARLATLDKKDKTAAEARAVAGVLEALLEKRPDHPGLMHYLVHAYDNPALAEHGVDIASKYAAVSPEAAHALHMPTHIFVRLGRWKDVIEGNLKSAEAGLKHPTADGRISRDFLHATDYLTYGYLQIADDDHAKAVAAKIDPATKFEQNSGPAAYALAATPARFAVERRMWKEAAALVPRKVDYNWAQYPWAEAITHAARGLGAARSGNLKSADAALAELDRLKPLIESPWWQGRLAIERDVVAAWAAHGRHDDKKAEQLLRAASERELASGKDSVEPGHVIIATEELGDLLLELKRPKEALDAFKAALKDSPHRFNALYGAGHAAELAGLTDEARTYYTELLAMTTGARPARVHAQAVIDKP